MIKYFTQREEKIMENTSIHPTDAIFEAMQSSEFAELEEKEKKLIRIFDLLMKHYSEDVVMKLSQKIDTLEDNLKPHLENLIKEHITEIDKGLEALSQRQDLTPEVVQQEVNQMVHSEAIEAIKQEGSISPELIALHNKIVDSVERRLEKHLRAMHDASQSSFTKTINSIGNVGRDLVTLIRESHSDLKREIGRTESSIRSLNIPRRLQ